MARYRVAVDIGGTFTDVVVADTETHAVRVGKVATTPHDIAEGVVAGVRGLVADPHDISYFVHGTTVGLNAFLERKGARVLLIMTAGYRDAYLIARGDRKQMYSMRYRKPQPLVTRADLHEVRERMRWDGAIIEPLHADDLEPIIRKLKDEEIASVAVCFLHSYVNPEHECQAADILRRAIPDLSITLSHEIAREWREYERASTAVMNAYVSPAIEKYLGALEERLQTLGLSVPLQVMQASGGVISAKTARRLPINTLLSGPVGGSIGGVALSEATGRPNLLCVDMGGTSFDMSLVVNGEAVARTSTAIQGLPLLIPMVDVQTIGAGGGSVAWLESGYLRVGPESAGAEPGPACYRRGGDRATVTDANLLLGRINPANFLGGRMALDEAAAAAAIGRIAEVLNLKPVTLAEGILSVINAKMADAMRTITIEHGLDPRAFSLVAFGGAGPMHAAWLAEALDIPEVIIPWSPGTFSAWGMLRTDLRIDLNKLFFHSASEVPEALLEQEYRALEQEGAAELSLEGILPEHMYYARSADMRYLGQEHTLNVRITSSDPDQVASAFHSQYQARYGHSTPADPIEFVNIRVEAYGEVERTSVKPTLSQLSGGSQVGTRLVTFAGVAYDTPTHRRDRMGEGSSCQGPAIIEEETATTVVPPGYDVLTDAIGNLIIRKRM